MPKHDLDIVVRGEEVDRIDQRPHDIALDINLAHITGMIGPAPIGFAALLP